MGEASKNEWNIKERKMKVNGSVGRQALSSLGFSPVIPPPPRPPILSFHTIKETRTASVTQQKNR